MSIKSSLFFLFALFLAAGLILRAAPHAQAEPSGELVIFHAGSLSVPFASHGKSF